MKVQTPLKKLRPKCKWARAKLPFQMARGTAHYQPPSQAHHGESVQNAMSRWCPENDSFYPEQDPIKLPLGDLHPWGTQLSVFVLISMDGAYCTFWAQLRCMLSAAAMINHSRHKVTMCSFLNTT